MNTRFLLAMASYGVLALLAGFTLDRTLRIVVWLFLALFAVKTWIANKQRNQG
jgi:hypothetical protein